MRTRASPATQRSAAAAATQRNMVSAPIVRATHQHSHAGSKNVVAAAASPLAVAVAEAVATTAKPPSSSPPLPLPLHDAPQPPAAVEVRHYDHGLDLPEIERICRDVYGGTDYMPRVVGERAARGDTVVLVADEATCGGGGGGDGDKSDIAAGGASRRPPLRGVVCGQHRGDGSVFVSGLRVCPDARRRGIALLLMDALERHVAPGADGRAPARTLLSTTVPAQAATLRIFARRGWAHAGTVEVWPPYAALYEYEAAVGWPGNSSDSNNKSSSSSSSSKDASAPAGSTPCSVLDTMPGAAAALEAAAAPASAWAPVKDAAALAAAVASVRRRQAAWRARLPPEGGDTSSNGNGGASEAAPRLWLPWAYDVIGVASDEAAALLAGRAGGDGSEGEFWALRLPDEIAGGDDAVGSGGSSKEQGSGSGADGQGGGGGGGGFAAVLLTARSRSFRRPCAGVLAASPAAAAAALARAAGTLGPHWVAFVDTGASYLGEPAVAADRRAWPLLFTGAAEPRSSYVVFAKARLQGDGDGGF